MCSFVSGPFTAWVFQLVDEWFKKCWNTWAVENEDSRSYWYNALTSETGFGIISTHPARHVVLDGNTDDWPAKISQNMGKQCSSSASDVLKTTGPLICFEQLSL